VSARLLLALVASVLLSSACAQVPERITNPHFDPQKTHHTPSGFKNNDIASVNKPLGELLRWQFEAWRDGLPKPPSAPVPTQAPDLDFIRANRSQTAVTWIGHASTLVQANGLNVLTDPIFSERAFPVQFAGPKRAQPPGVVLADLPPIDVVIISHNHYDHLDRLSVFALDQRAKSARQQPGTLFLVPLGLKAWFAGIGIDNVVELDWWQKHSVRGTDFYLVPVQHWSARSFSDRSETLWGGWAVMGPQTQWYFSGDAGYSKDFARTYDFFATHRHLLPGSQATPKPALFDFALLAVGAYEPRWFMKEQHINPAEAVQAHRDVGARRSIGVHWGTFNLTDEPLDQPPRDLAAARRAAGVPDDEFVVLKIGETARLPR
jgi:N-acyl-phosphatidylethanolamine-hydrolysing phospholipase D